MTDLFVKQSKRDLLLEYIREKKWVRTSEVIRWGSQNFSNRSDRDARQLAKDGLIRRMSKEDKRFYFSGAKEDVWVAI